jgi:hypothetical protein
VSPSSTLHRKVGTAPVVLLLLAAILIVYFPVRTYEFINFDDDIYVTGNAMLRGGLSLSSLAQAFTDLHAFMWIPLTWISYLIEADVHGLAAGAMHVTNVLIHAIGAAVLFLVLTRLTGRKLESALAAGFFALHPLRVESVAWITERKDVLSGLFLFLALAAYVGYQRDRRLHRYLLSLAFYICSLMSKPMFVTLPFLLVLLDYWPLGRLHPFSARAVQRLLVEKIPFLALALAATVINVLAQSHMNALAPTNFLSLETRVALAIVSYVTYLKMTLWPTGLAILYPHPEVAPPAWVTAGSAGLLALVTLLAGRASRSHPFVTVGWAWHLIVLFPVIGLTQRGYQLLADRFTYVASLGPILVVTWGASSLAGRSRARGALLAVAGGLALLVLSGISSSQVKHWRNSYTVFSRAVAVTKDNYVAHANLAQYFLIKGDTDEALIHARKAVAIYPENPQAQNNLGVALMRKRAWQEAIAHFQAALQIDPGYPNARKNLQSALWQSRFSPDSVKH